MAPFWYNEYMDKEKLKTYINQNISQNKIAKLENVSLSTVRYWFKKHGLKSNFSSILALRRSWTDDDLVIALKDSYFMSDVIKKLGLLVRPGNYDTVKKHIKRLNLDVSHLNNTSHNTKKNHRGGGKRIEDSKLFVKNSKHGRGVVKNRIIKDKLIDYSCAICKIAEWRGHKLSLVLDHKNGVNNDHRLENLRLLCSNCNSLQPTFCRKS